MAAFATGGHPVVTHTHTRQLMDDLDTLSSNSYAYLSVFFVLYCYGFLKNQNKAVWSHLSLLFYCRKVPCISLTHFLFQLQILSWHTSFYRLLNFSFFFFRMSYAFCIIWWCLISGLYVQQWSPQIILLSKLISCLSVCAHWCLHSGKCS